MLDVWVQEIVVYLVYEELAASCVWTCIGHSYGASVVAVVGFEFVSDLGY